MKTKELSETYGGRWAEIKDFPGYYVSDQGQVYSDKVKRLLKGSISQNGYKTVMLCKHGKLKLFSVHQLVAKAFIPNPENKDVVNHKDGVKQNNSVENLEWVTQPENNYHARETGLIKDAVLESDKNKARKLYETGNYSQKDLAEMFSVSVPAMHKILKGVKKRHIDPHEKDKKEVCELYKTGRYSQRELAEKYGVNQGTVSCWLKENGIITRDTPKRKQKQYSTDLPEELRDFKYEKWKPIDDYPGYFVSDAGLVYSKRKGGLLNTADRNGYRKVNLFQNKKCKTFYVHTLVAKAFIPNPENKEVVNHKNGDRTDNRVENLEWVTRPENNQHAKSTGLMKHAYSEEIKNSVRSDYETGKYSQKDLSEKYGIPMNTIRRMVNGVKKKIIIPYEEKRLKACELFREGKYSMKEIADMLEVVPGTVRNWLTKSGVRQIRQVKSLSEDEKEELYSLYLTGEWKQKDLAKKFGVAGPTICTYLKEKGISYEDSCKRKIQEAYHLYQTGDYTQQQLAEMFGVSRRTVERWFKTYKSAV